VTGFNNRVISTNRCERNHGDVKSRLRPIRGLKSFECTTRLFLASDALQLIERGLVRVSCTGVPKAGGSYLRACDSGSAAPKRMSESTNCALSSCVIPSACWLRAASLLALRNLLRVCSGARLRRSQVKQPRRFLPAPEGDRRADTVWPARLLLP
jgi:hypothetical protein